MTFGSASSQISSGFALPRRHPYRLSVVALSLTAFIATPAGLSAAPVDSNSAASVKTSLQAQLRAAAAWSEIAGPAALSSQSGQALTADASGCPSQSAGKARSDSYAPGIPTYNANFRAPAWVPSASAADSRSKQFPAASGTLNARPRTPAADCVLSGQNIFPAAHPSTLKSNSSSSVFDDSFPSPSARSLNRAAPQPLAFAPALDRSSRHSGEAALASIPADVDIDQLGLSPEGMAMAREAQNHGVYIFDEGPAGVSIVSQPGEPEIRWGAGDSPAWRRDFSVIVSRLHRVTGYIHLPFTGSKPVKSAYASSFPN